MFVFFLMMSFGFLFVHRTTIQQLNRKTLPEAICKLNLKMQYSLFWLITLLSPWTPVLISLFLIFFQIIITSRLELVLNIILRQRFKENMLKFLDELILMMMTGKSFRDSFNLITQNSNNYFYLKLKSLLSFNVFNSLTDSKNENINKNESLKTKELKNFCDLVQMIESNPHKAIEKIKSYRKELQIILNFEKKLRQSTIQIRTQAMVLTFLYLTLLIFTYKMKGSIHFTHLIPSLILFLSGHLCILFLGRKRKWKT